MACEEFLEQMEAAAIEIDNLDSDIQQLENQKAAQMGIMYGAYMLYMICMNNQGGGMARSTQKTTALKNPTVSELIAWVKKKIKALRRKK